MLSTCTRTNMRACIVTFFIYTFQIYTMSHDISQVNSDLYCEKKKFIPKSLTLNYIIVAFNLFHKIYLFLLGNRRVF